MSSTPGAVKALRAAQFALQTNLSSGAPEPPAWLRAAMRLHGDAVGLDAIAVALGEAGHPPEAVQLAVAAIRSDMRRLGLFWSRAAAR
jgi:hypothetical protein